MLCTYLGSSSVLAVASLQLWMHDGQRAILGTFVVHLSLATSQAVQRGGRLNPQWPVTFLLVPLTAS